MNNILFNIKARTIKSLLVALPMMAAVSTLTTSCIKEETPTNVLSKSQVEGMSETQLNMLYGLSSFMVSYNTWGGSDYLNDWGFPCQMYFREVNGEDFPVYQSTYDYWTYHENGTYASSYTIYTWYFYYKLIHNCNNLIGIIDANTANTDSKRYLGSALAFRAMAYLDLARSFEFKPTGYANLDNQAEANGLWGLTCPIVTEKTTNQDGLSNPRVDFCQMYRFIMNDLRTAEQLLGNYNPNDVSLPGIRAVKGLMARAWMEIGSRYEEKNPQLQNYIAKMQESDKLNDGYGQIGVYTAAGCYNNAYTCAMDAASGLSYMTSSEWHDSKTGFNKATSSWIWRARCGNKEQQSIYYCSFLGQTATEALSGLPYAYKAFRCIGDYLYSKIADGDWRKTTWVDPDDAEKSTTAIRQKYQTLLDSVQFKKVPAYANLKFRPGEGDITTIAQWLICDLPVMRAEEMLFIAAEAKARAVGYQEGMKILTNFVQNSRYSSGTYKPVVGSLNTFLNELMIQKRIELWGEGITYFDYKRLNLQVDRSRSTNVEDAFMIKSKEGYCCPWMNYYIPQGETNRNTACKANPDVSGDYQ